MVQRMPSVKRSASSAELSTDKSPLFHKSTCSCPGIFPSLAGSLPAQGCRSQIATPAQSSAVRNTAGLSLSNNQECSCMQRRA